MMANSVAARVFSLSCVLVGVLIVGTCGFALLEGWTIIDSLFMTLITISTVGYGEVHELSLVGRLFTSVLIGLSMISVVCWTAGITSILVSNDLTGELRKKKELKMISNLVGHVIVCGAGTMARTIVAGLVPKNKQVVIISNDESKTDLLRRLYPELLVVKGDPTCELSLADANVLNAQYLIAATESDHDNLLITITGSGLGTDIVVLSCSLEGGLASKMLKVGAKQVVCPLVLCGEHVVSIMSEDQLERPDSALVTSSQ